MLIEKRNLILGVLSFLIFIFIVQIIFVKSVHVPNFTYANYKEQQRIFNACYGSTLPAKKKELETFINTVHTTTNSNELKQNSLSLISKTKCRVSFVSQSDEQLRDMAKEVAMVVKKQYVNKDVKLLNTTYTMDEQFSALLQQPRSYVFYAISNDETQMFAFVVKPQEDKTFHIEELWDEHMSKDIVFVHDSIIKILLIYNQKIF